MVMKKIFLFLSLLFVSGFSCDDTRVADETPQELIQMWLDGTEIPVYDYYESITTLGVTSHEHEAHEGVCMEPPTCMFIRKVFVIHFQKDAGRVSPEKEHYALIMYDANGLDNYDLIDEGVYVNPSSESTKGVTLEIVGLSDYTSNAQAVISKNEDNVVDGLAEGTFYNPYSEQMQNGLLMFENITIGTDTANTFYSEFY